MKKTIAERKVTEKKQRRVAVPLVLCLPFAVIFYFCKFVLPGYSFMALVCLCIIGIILFYSVMPVIALWAPGFAHTATSLFTGLLILGLLVCGITEGIIIRASFGDPDKSCDYVVVLGAKVRLDGPSVSLQDRIDAAYNYLVAHPDVIAVVSGGQGLDEHMTEGRCMFNELTAMGIPAERVWVEEAASSTWENLHFSLDLIEEKTGQRPEKIGVLSSEYHLFRASLFAKACGVEFVGVPAHTSRPSQMLNHFMREVAGVWHYLILGGTYDA